LKINAYKLFNEGETLRKEKESLAEQLPKKGIGADATHVRLQILHLEKLLEFLDSRFRPMKGKMDELLCREEITFDLLWCLFPEGTEITFKDNNSGLICGGKVNTSIPPCLSEVRSRIPLIH